MLLKLSSGLTTGGLLSISQLHGVSYFVYKRERHGVSPLQRKNHDVYNIHNMHVKFVVWKNVTKTLEGDLKTSAKDCGCSVSKVTGYGLVAKVHILLQVVVCLFYDQAYNVFWPSQPSIQFGT
jgi:hypothetical protein